MSIYKNINHCVKSASFTTNCRPGISNTYLLHFSDAKLPINQEYIKKFTRSGASLIQTEYNEIVPYFGSDLARTVIEYLDKDTGKPVILLFPTTIHIFDGYNEKNYIQHLSRRAQNDFYRQMEIRTAMIDKYIQETMHKKSYM